MNQNCKLIEAFPICIISKKVNSTHRLIYSIRNETKSIEISEEIKNSFLEKYDYVISNTLFLNSYGIISKK